jgi:hypothetical protein
MGEGFVPRRRRTEGCSWTHGVSRAGEAASDVEGMDMYGICNVLCTASGREQELGTPEGGVFSHGDVLG